MAIYSAGQPAGCGDSSWDAVGQVEPLSSGAARDITIPGRAFPYPTDWRVYAFVDYTCSITETNDAGNVFGPATVPVTDPVPDLAIESAVAVPTGVAEGQGVTLTIRVSNRGNASAVAASAVGVYVDQAIGYCNDPQPVAGWVTVPALAAGAYVDLVKYVPAAAFGTGQDPHEIFLFEKYYCSGPDEECL